MAKELKKISKHVSLYDMLELRLISEAIADFNQALIDHGDYRIELEGDDVDVQLHINRMETEEEADVREAQEAERAARQEAAMRRQYAELKAKFEPADKAPVDALAKIIAEEIG